MLIADYKFDNSADVLPVFNTEFTIREYNDDILENNITHRKIYADTLPTSISFSGITNLIECGYLALDNVISLEQAFTNCTGLQLIDATNWNVSGVISFDMTFCYCENLTDILGIENWETTNLGNGSSRGLVATFGFCSSLKKIDLRNWEVNYTISCNSTFTTCTDVIEIFLPKKFSPINILAMFQNCNSLVEIHGLERIEHLTSGSNRRPFENCYALKKVSMPNLDASLATTLDTMFSNCTSLEEIDLSHAKISDTCKVTTFLNNCSSLKTITINGSSPTIVKSIINQITSNTFESITVIGAENILDELRMISTNVDWEIIPLGRRPGFINNGQVICGDSKLICMVFGRLDL